MLQVVLRRESESPEQASRSNGKLTHGGLAMQLFRLMPLIFPPMSMLPFAVKVC